MIKGIIHKFNRVIESYKELIETSESKFEYLKKKNFQQIEQTNKKEMLLYHDLKTFLNELKQSVVHVCKEKNENEYRLQSLIPYMSVEEKEQIMACQRYAFSYEQTLRNNLKKNECLVQALMATQSIVVESIAELMSQERINNLSKKF